MSRPELTFSVEDLIDEARAERSSTRVRRSRLGLGVSLLVTVVWLIYVSASGQWPRVLDNWASAVTMIFGSFVAGSTPQGGGAVAFPVFTKLLEIPGEVARTFSLSIQSVGMTAASLGILVNRRGVDWRALSIAAPSAVIGFIIGYLTLIDRATPFGEAVLPGAHVKVMFTIIVAAMAFVTYLGYRVQLIEQRHSVPAGNTRVVTLLVVCGLLGGATSALVGSGTDVFVYLAMVPLVGVTPRVGIATSVLAMTVVSLVGLIVFGIAEGHLSVDLANDRESVVTLAQRPVVVSGDSVAFGAGAPLPDASRFDLFGLWLAAAPVVAWGAPLGSLVSSRATDRQVVKFVIFLAVVETVSTVIFLDALRTDATLALFAIGALALTFGLVWSMTRRRRRLLGLPPLDPQATVTRGSVDVGPNARAQLGLDGGPATGHPDDSEAPS